MPVQGSRRALGLLRLPGRTLEAPADDQPHRKHLRHHSPTPSTDQGMRHAASQPDHDVQARSVSTEEVATTQRARPHRSSLGRKEVRQRSSAGRRLKNSQNTTIDNSSNHWADLGYGNMQQGFFNIDEGGDDYRRKKIDAQPKR